MKLFRETKKIHQNVRQIAFRLKKFPKRIDEYLKETNLRKDQGDDHSKNDTLHCWKNRAQQSVDNILYHKSVKVLYNYRVRERTSSARL
jgi:hypothetical protein